MVFYLDSAQIEEAQQVIPWGWVKGITTNPILLAKSQLSPVQTLEKLTAICPGELYYQLTTLDFEAMVKEARQAHNIIGDKLVLKVPATAIGFQVVAYLSPEIACSVTGIYNPAQAAVAAEAGAKYAIAYVNRATRLLGDGIALVSAMSQVLKNSPTRILAASLKSATETSQAIQAGADVLTLPLAMLQALTYHEYSEQTFIEFNANGRGILD